MPEIRVPLRLTTLTLVCAIASATLLVPTLSAGQTVLQTPTGEELSVTSVRKRLLRFREQLVADSKNEPARQGLAEMAVYLARAIGRLDLAGDGAAAEELVQLVRTQLADTGWRVGYMARNGNIDAQGALGVMYERGLVFKASKTSACEHYRKAARLGDTLARSKMSDCAATSTTETATAAQPQPQAVLAAPAAVRQQREESGSLLAQLLAALEHAEANAVASAIAQLSDLAAKRVSTDLWSLERDAASGDAGAELALATVYRRGLGVAENAREACRLYQRAARTPSGNALYRAALCIAETDRVESLRVLQRAAQLGHAGAQELLARSCLQDGNVSCALEWLCHAARQGRASAQSLLAWVYASGEGVQADPKRAFFLYVLAAKSGEIVAQNNLGELFETGAIGVSDPSSAAVWYKRAAKSGLAQAQLNLGRLYAQGEGLPKDAGMAGYWLNLAAKQGSKDAGKLIQWLAEQESGG